jgi:hypothetical protein
MQKLSSSAVLSIIGVLICTTLVACKSGDSKLPPQAVERPVAQGLQGVWNAPAYGMVLSVTDTEHVFYQTTSDYCQIFDFDMVLDMDFDEVLASMQLSSDQSSILMSFAGAKSPGMVMNRQTELPGNCVTNLLKQSTDVGYEFDAERDFNIFWQTFNEHYAFFHLEGIDWNEVYQQASGSISGSTTEAELFEILSEMVAPLKDFHVQLGNEELDEEFSVNRKPGITEIVFQEFIEINAIEPPLSEQQYQQFFQYYGQQYDRWLEVLVDHFDEDAEGFSNDSETINWGMLQDDLGYILIDTMTAEVIGESDSYEQNLG